MNQTVPIPLAPLVQKIFTERPINQLGASTNTFASYRDSFRLFVEFAEVQCGLTSTDMDFPDIDAELVANLSEHVETERGDSVESRNVRLAATRPFFSNVELNICSRPMW